MPVIQECAMLANLTISMWTARKHDKRASDEVDKAHAAHDAGRYNKLLVDKAALEPMTKAASALRTLHYSLTLAWGDNGDRLLPSALFLDYSAKIRDATIIFNNATAAFVAKYPFLVADARHRLGTLYEPGDYPPATQISQRFSANVGFAPIAKADDFRVNVGEASAKLIREEITRQAEQRLAESTKECWTRVRDVLTRYAERLADSKGKVYDSMIDNARDLVALLPALNVAGDPELTRVAQEIENRLLHASADKLRTSAVTRQTVAKAANDILANFKWG